MLSKEDKRDLALLNRSFDKTKEYEPNFLSYERMYNSEHTAEFLALAKEKERNAIFIPLTYSTINIADSVFTTAFFSGGNPIELSRVGAKDEIKKSQLQRLIDYYYNKAKPYNELSRAFFSITLFGSGTVNLVWDSVKKEPDTTMIPITELAFDIDAISPKDSEYSGYRFKQSIKAIKEKLKSKFYTCSDKYDKEKLLSGISKNPYIKKVVKEIFIKEKESWTVKTFCDGICLRKKSFKRNQLISGYMLHILPAIDETVRDNQIAAIGDSLVRVIKPLNDELNVKRNQKMDLTEQHINPPTWVSEKTGLDPEDENKNGGIKHCSTTAGVMFQPIVGAGDFTTDVSMIKSDIEDASSVNGIMRGNTSSSDRRSGSALANVNANSSIRLESMVKLGNETLFDPWANDFVRLIYLNADDAFINKLLEIPQGETHSLGKKGMRAELDIDIKINFGISINKNAKVQDLVNIVQMVKENPNANTDALMEQIIKLSLGENVNAKEILGLLAKSGNEKVPRGANDQVAQTPLGTNGRDKQGEAARVGESDESLSRAKKLSEITNNEI